MLINRQRRVRVNTKPLTAFLDAVCAKLRIHEFGVSVCLLSDASIAQLNRAFRGKPGPTDVLSFPSGNGSNYLGDIAISPESARRNAARLGRTLPQELRILILHGVLHLMGYDHETDNGRMHRVERHLRAELGLR